jgi:DNA-binding PadR family transcriptional regulator
VPNPGHSAFIVCILAAIYQTDISDAVFLSGAHVLELAILGLLKEQPLHGYELKKRLSDTLGSLWGISYGSLYPALRRLERDASIESVEPGSGIAPIPATGSLDGDLAAARLRRTAKPSRRTRKAYRITEHGDARFAQLLLDGDTSPDDERAFVVKLAFCRHLDPASRLELLERRRSALADRLSRQRRSGPGRADRYTASLFEHRTESTERDLQWVDALIADERRESPPVPSPSRDLVNPSYGVLTLDVTEQGATTT